MSADYGGMMVICPYWRCTDGRRITCEGLIDNTLVIWVFNNAAEARQQEHLYCRKHWKRCEMCLSIERFRNLDGDDDG